jgi:hypothetical protein
LALLPCTKSGDLQITHTESILDTNMQSPVGSPAPRTAILRSHSSQSIHVDHDISVVSGRASGSREVSKHARSSRTQSVTYGQERAQTSHGFSFSPSHSTSSPQLNGWNSESRLSMRSQPSPRRNTAANVGSVRVELLQSNRENMKALSEFLRTKARSGHCSFWNLKADMPYLGTTTR